MSDSSHLAGLLNKRFLDEGMCVLVYTTESPEPIVFRPCEERQECFIPAYGSLLFAEGDFKTMVNQRTVQVILFVPQITAIIFRTPEELEEETS